MKLLSACLILLAIWGGSYFYSLGERPWPEPNHWTQFPIFLTSLLVFLFGLGTFVASYESRTGGERSGT